MSRRRRALVAVVAGLTLVLTGCVQLPESGSVKVSPVADAADQQAPFDFAPAGPKAGASQVDIVKNFLVAMTATPLTTYAARQYLTSESRDSWVPGDGTVIYGSDTQPAWDKGVVLKLDETTELDARGGWLGDPTGGEGLRYRLRLVKEEGEWRISNPPDRLMIPQSHFDTRFQAYSLFFFDSAGKVLVPEPVYLPAGAQTPTLLVAGLLRGPGPGLRGVERSYLPARVELGDLSVPVTRDGVAEVPLTEAVLDLEPARLDMATAQLAWTLRQVPGVSRLRITVDGSPLQLAGTESVEAGEPFDPAVDEASGALYGLRDGRAVGVSGSKEYRIPGVFESKGQDVRSIGVNMTGTLFAEVTANGRTVLVSARTRPPVDDPASADVSTIYEDGVDLLRPVWDLHGQLWLVDRTSEGAVVSVITEGETRVVNAPGISGERVSSFTLSRDGSRLVAELRQSSGDALVVARVAHSESGEVRRIRRATVLPTQNRGITDVRALAWRTPTTLAVLNVLSRRSAQVAFVQVDGSVPPTSATGPELFQGRATSLAAAPTPLAPLYLGDADGQLYELTGNGRWVGTSTAPGLQSPTYVG